MGATAGASEPVDNSCLLLFQGNCFAESSGMFDISILLTQSIKKMHIDMELSFLLLGAV